MIHPLDGFLVIDKPEGPSSQQVVSQVKRALRVKKAGHTGTLDPLATGVLPIALGEATKVIPYLDESQKVYRVAGILGLSTQTYDSQGAPLRHGNFDSVTEAIFKQKLQGFLGEQLQTPPPYSAIKLHGKPLYRYARAGQTVELKARPVTFLSLQLLAYEKPRFEIELRCSRGTYVRSLVHDLGEQLGCGAHVTALRRLATGRFDLNAALSLPELMAEPERACRQILSIERCLAELPQLDLDSEREAEMIRAGVPLHRLQEWFQLHGRVESPVLLKFNGRILAIVQARAEGSFGFQRVLQEPKNLEV